MKIIVYITLTWITLFCAYQLNQEQYSKKHKTIVLSSDVVQESTIPDENDTLEERINAELKREINDHEEEWMEEMNKEDIVIAEQTGKNDTDANYEKDQVQFNFNSILKKMGNFYTKALHLISRSEEFQFDSSLGNSCSEESFFICFNVHFCQLKIIP